MAQKINMQLLLRTFLAVSLRIYAAIFVPTGSQDYDAASRNGDLHHLDNSLLAGFGRFWHSRRGRIPADK